MEEGFKLNQNVTIKINGRAGIVKGIWHVADAATKYNVQYTNTAGSVLWDWFTADDLA